MPRGPEKSKYWTLSLDKSICSLSQLRTISSTVITLFYIYWYTQMQVRTHSFNYTLYLCKVFLYDIISHLSSIQLSIKSSTNHGHDVIYTSHPVLVSQQISNQNREGSLECQTRSLQNNTTHKHTGTAATSMLVCTISNFFSCKSSSFLKLNDCISFLWKTLRANGKNCKNVSFSKSLTTMKMRKESWV